PVEEVHLVLANNLGHVSPDDERCRFIQANPQELWMCSDNAAHVVKPIALGEVLVNSRSRQKVETSLVTRSHHLLVAQRGSAHQYLTLNRGSRGTAADQSPAAEHVMKGRDRIRALVGIDEAPLPAAAEPDSSGLLQHVEKFGRINF